MPVQEKFRDFWFVLRTLFQWQNERAFTLIEIVIVVTILGVITVVGISNFKGLTQNTNQTKIKADVDAIAKAYELSYDPITRRYRGLVDSDFNAGKKPTDTTGQSYNYPIAEGAFAESFQICAPLDNSSTCNITSNSCYCRSSNIGTAVAAVFPTFTPTPTLSPTPTLTPTPTPIRTSYMISTDYSSTQGLNSWYYYYKSYNSNSPAQAIYGNNGNMQPTAWYGQPTNNNSWFDCYGSSCWGMIAPSKITGSDSNIAIVYWRAPLRGTATMTVTQTKTDNNCNGWSINNGYKIGVGSVSSIGSWPSSFDQIISVGSCDTSTKTLTLNKSFQGNGDGFIYFDDANNWTYNDAANYAISINFSPQ